MEELLALPELGSVLHLSLHATSRTRPGAYGGDLRPATAEPELPNSPAFRKLVEEILFSRRFILTYYFAIFFVLIIFSAGHWYDRFKRSRSRSKPDTPATEDPGSSIASSSSSTLQGTRSPPLEDDLRKNLDEQTQLLAKDSEDLTAPETQTTLVRSIHRFTAFLVYQPAPFPAMTSPTNTPPPNGTTILIFVFFGINIFYLFYHTPISIPMLFALADRAGLCFVVNLPVLYVLAAKTNLPIKFLTGWSYEGLNIFHRRLGEWMTALAIIHTVGMFGVWYTLLRPLNFSLLRFLSSRLVLLGILTFLAYIAIYITSTGYFRHMYYETFLGLHIVLQVAALIFLFFHHHNSRPYVIACFGIWAFDRLVSRLIISTKSFVATLEIAEDGETILLYCDIPIKRFMSTHNLDMASGWQPGQHVFVTIPGIGWKHQLQAHPFSIASPAPPADLASGKWPLELIIRAKDGFSKELLDYAKHHQHTQIRLDGPYGGTDALEALHHADRQCLIAGGSGIAVTYPLAWSLMVEKHRPDALVSTRSIYEDGRKHVPEVTTQKFASESFAHIWIQASSTHRKWIKTLPKLDALARQPEADMAESRGPKTVGWMVTGEHVTRTQGVGNEVILNRPDVGWLLRQWAENCSGTNQARTGKGQSICVVVSGPDGLVRDVRNASAAMVAEGWNIEVFVEKFGW